MKMLKDLLRYVATTKHMGIVYGKHDTTDASGPLVGYVDASWGEPKCRGGYIFNAWRSPIAWSSYKLTATALSSAESEYMSAAIATQEALWLRYLASDLGYGDLKLQEFGKLCDRDFIRSTLTRRTHKGECPITIFEDNKACIQISQNPVLHKRSRHIHLKYHFLRYHYQKGHVELAFIPTKENIADLMTKRLPKNTHYYLCNKLLHACVEGKLTKFDGTVIPNVGPSPVRDELKFPDLSKYLRDDLREISDFQDERTMRIADPRRKLESADRKWLSSPMSLEGERSKNKTKTSVARDQVRARISDKIENRIRHAVSRRLARAA